MNDCSICKNYEPVTAKMAGQKTAKGNPDVVQVVRCKDCKNCNMEDENERWCLGWGSPARLVAPDSYCSRGIRKEGQR